MKIRLFALLMTTNVYSFQHMMEAKIDYQLGTPYRQIIENDFENLCRPNFNLNFDDKEALERFMMRMMDIQKVNCKELRRYLEENIELIIRDYKDHNITVIDQLNPTQKTNQFNLLERAVVASASDFVEAVESNYSSAINIGLALHKYFYGKNNLWTQYSGRPIETTDFFFDTVTDRREKKIFTIRSIPNIILVTRNFFASEFHPNQKKNFAVSNSLKRIAILIHESRHNKGKLTHVPCAHLEVSRKCDDDIEGPNGLSGVFLLYASLICKAHCTQKEQSILEKLARVQLQRINSLYPFSENILNMLAEEIDREESTIS